MACHLTIDKAGKVKAWRFTRALIRVAANIPYEQAQAAIDAAESGKSDGRFEADGIDLVDNALKPLWACWALLAKARGKREPLRSEEHTSELQSLMRISYAVFCLKKKNHKWHNTLTTGQHENTPEYNSTLRSQVNT